MQSNEVLRSRGELLFSLEIDLEKKNFKVFLNRLHEDFCLSLLYLLLHQDEYMYTTKNNAFCL